jgi:hypothetical protein
MPVSKRSQRPELCSVCKKTTISEFRINPLYVTMYGSNKKFWLCNECFADPKQGKSDKERHKHRYLQKRNESVSLSSLDNWITGVRTIPRPKGHICNPLGLDPLRDQSIIALLWYSGFRITEIVGDRKRTYSVQSDYAHSNEARNKARDEMSPEKTWKKYWDAYWKTHKEYNKNRTSPDHEGILGRDITKISVPVVNSNNEILKYVNYLEIKAIVKKNGYRHSPLRLNLDWKYVNFIEEQWMKTSPDEPVWGGVFDKRREYVWKMIKEIDPTIYPHFFRFNRASKMASMNVPITTLLAWFGWKRIETATDYLERGGQSVMVGVNAIDLEQRIEN